MWHPLSEVELTVITVPLTPSTFLVLIIGSAWPSPPVADFAALFAQDGQCIQPPFAPLSVPPSIILRSIVEVQGVHNGRATRRARSPHPPTSWGRTGSAPPRLGQVALALLARNVVALEVRIAAS